MTFNFPRVHFVSTNILWQQVDHLRGEVQEVDDALQQADLSAVAMELMDVIHSAETALRILQERFRINLHETRRDVERKNMERGYYSAHPPKMFCGNDHEWYASHLPAVCPQCHGVAVGAR